MFQIVDGSGTLLTSDASGVGTAHAATSPPCASLFRKEYVLEALPPWWSEAWALGAMAPYYVSAGDVFTLIEATTGAPLVLPPALTTANALAYKVSGGSPALLTTMAWVNGQVQGGFSYAASTLADDTLVALLADPDTKTLALAVLATAFTINATVTAPLVLATRIGWGCKNANSPSQCSCLPHYKPSFGYTPGSSWRSPCVGGRLFGVWGPKVGASGAQTGEYSRSVVFPAQMMRLEAADDASCVLSGTATAPPAAGTAASVLPALIVVAAVSAVLLGLSALFVVLLYRSYKAALRAHMHLRRVQAHLALARHAPSAPRRTVL